MIEKVKEALAPYGTFQSYAGEYTFLIPRSAIREVFGFLKEKLGFDYLVDIGVVDHFVEGERFEVFYNLVHLQSGTRIRIKCRVPEEDPTVESITDLYPSAAWHEREAWDMMGIRFLGHPDLRRMYMPEDFKHHPLRKEFPLLGFGPSDFGL